MKTAILSIFCCVFMAGCCNKEVIGPGSHSYHAEAMQQARRSAQVKDGVFFFGDSQTVGLATSNIARKSENFGISGDTVDGLIGRMPLYHLDGARLMVLEIGINNWAVDKFQGFGAKYQRLLSLIPAQIPVVAVAIFPVNAHAGKSFAGAPTAIIEANRGIENACKRRPACTFLDLTPTMAELGGDLKAAYEVGDGEHLSTAGYEVWNRTISVIVRAAGS